MDTRFILVRAERPYIQFVAARVISTEKRFVVGGTNGGERDRSQVPGGVVERTTRALLLLGRVVHALTCRESIPLSGSPALPFIGRRGEQGLQMGERGKYQRYRRSFEGAGSSFFPVPAQLNMADRVRGGMFADPHRPCPGPF